MTVSPEEHLDRTALTQLQRERWHVLRDEILPQNAFYARKLAAASLTSTNLRMLEDPRQLPFTTKADLLADQAGSPPYGRILTWPVSRYVRLHQTSGTTGRPLRWLDTPQSWQGMLHNWEILFRIAGVQQGDRLFFPFSFGPFLGFWTAFEAAVQLGYFCLPGGGMSSTARLRFLLDHQVTVVFCTPTYALHLAEAARAERIDLAASAVRALIVAGEPGGCIPATRSRIEAAWGARVIDHWGLTELGPMAIECQENPAGLHILESECLVEIIDPETAQPASPGQVGELVVTNLGRLGSPLVRYRTGDLVLADTPCCCGRTFLRLNGGIRGRCDDMIHLRGNNFYPSALEAVIRRFPEVIEYRVEVDQSGPLANLRIEVEPAAEAPRMDIAERVGRAIRDELLFRAEVTAVAPGTLPRFEMKARRINKR
jgi:phenylacetate-CoA ligase